jgi:hypothetical protein
MRPIPAATGRTTVIPSNCRRYLPSLRGHHQTWRSLLPSLWQAAPDRTCPGSPTAASADPAFDARATRCAVVATPLNHPAATLCHAANPSAAPCSAAEHRGTGGTQAPFTTVAVVDRRHPRASLRRCHRGDGHSVRTESHRHRQACGNANPYRTSV